MNFLDSTVFIDWFKAAKRDLSKLEVALSGFILYRIEGGEEALTSSLVKDEAALWLSRYKRSKLADFLESIESYPSLRVEAATPEDEKEAERHLGMYSLGYIDCINLALMHRKDIDRIYTSDKGFDEVSGIHRIFMELERDPSFPEFLSWAHKRL